MEGLKARPVASGKRAKNSCQPPQLRQNHLNHTYKTRYFSQKVGVLVIVHPLRLSREQRKSPGHPGAFSFKATETGAKPFRWNILTINPFGMNILEEIDRAKPPGINILDNKYPPGGTPQRRPEKRL
jgi:hypothetical protein